MKLHILICFLGFLWTTSINFGSSMSPVSAATNNEEGRLRLGLIHNMTKRIRPRQLDKIFKCPVGTTKEYTPSIARARALTCHGTGNIDVTIPIRNKNSDFQPNRLTLTVDRDEEVVVEFERTPSSNDTYVKWQKEVVDKEGSWNYENISDDQKLILPKDKTEKSGLYSFMLNRLGSDDVSRLCTVALIRTRCPKYMYGDECDNYCKDCMYGGICDADTGECICPPGRKGENCEEACDKEKNLSNCTESLLNEKGFQYCLPAPYGCSCLPGYKGFRCNETCDSEHWGVDCKQTCFHCESNKCSSNTGICEKKDEKPCAGGKLGLPRLQNKPEVEKLEMNKATIKFDTKSTDGGLPPKGEVKGYHIKLTDMTFNNDEPRSKFIGNTSSYIIKDLEPATYYKFSVLIEVGLDSTSCIVDGSMRGERIHVVEFFTKCPDVPGRPTNITTDPVNQNNFTISTDDYLEKKCDLTYEVEVKLKDSNSEPIYKGKLDTPKHTVGNLKSFTSYSYKVWAVTSENIRSQPFEDDVETLPKLPKTPEIKKEEHNRQVSFSWTRPQGTEGHEIFYEYEAETTFLACPNGNKPKTKGKTTNEKVDFLSPTPHSRLNFTLRMGNEAGLSEIKTFKTHIQKEDKPSLKVEHMERIEKSDIFNVSLERNCSKINGNGLTIHAELEYVKNEMIKNENYSTIPTPSFFCYDIFQCTVQLPENLYHYTKYKLTVYAKNDRGTNNIWDESAREEFRTDPVAPHEPEEVKVLGAHKSLTVKWTAPKVFPPTGDIERYLVSWYLVKDEIIGNGSTVSKEFTITGLETNTSYNIEVSAKNKNVTAYGPKALATGKTEAKKPLTPCNVTTESTTTEIKLCWGKCDEHSDSENFELFYFLSFTDGVESKDNTSDTCYEFEGLEPSSGYNLTLKACNEWKCSDPDDRVLYTKPKKPQVDSSGFKVLTSAGNITEIGLPKVEVLPVWQLVVVVEVDKGINDAEVKNISKELVTKRMMEKLGIRAETSNREKRSVDEELGIHAETSNREKRSLDGELGIHAETSNREKSVDEKGVDAWIAAEVYLEEENQITSVNISKGEGDMAMSEEQDYKLTVVTVAVSGDHMEIDVTEPISNELPPILALGAILGILFAFVFLALVVALAYKYRKKNPRIFLRDRRTDQEVILPENRIEPISLPDISDRSSVIHRPLPPLPLPPPPPVPGTRRHTYKEPLYVNMSNRTPFHNIESYLARAINSMELSIEFENVPKDMGGSCSHAEHPVNRPKNRYKNILPYNDTRVRLPRLREQKCTDYINANFIQGHARPNAYIATQGPKDANNDTIDDFWRMIWCNNCQLILMVANLFENGRSKVAQYWPTTAPIKRGGVEIAPVSEEIKMDFIIRGFTLTKEDEIRTLTHFQYTSWPDHGVPENPYGLAQMLIQAMRVPSVGPYVVHCSAGIGRTGTVLFTLGVLDQIHQSGYMDGKEALTLLRQGRAKLLENLAQYTFAHKLLQEILCGGKTAFTCAEFPRALQRLREPTGEMEMSTIQEQFHKIKTTPRDLTFKFAQKREFAHLNRSTKILPADSRTVFLESSGTEESQYINAIWVRSIDAKNAYVVSEHPMPHTLSKTWQMIYEYELSSWTLIHSFPEGGTEEYPSVLPKGNEMMVDKYLITKTQVQDFDKFTEYHVTIKPMKRSLVEQPPRKCVVIQMNGWPHTEPSPESVMPLLAVMERAESLMSSQRRGLFTCKDGATGCGIMMSLLLVMGKIKLHQEVNVYRSVLDITFDRPEFISTEEQYDLVHEGAAQYLSAYGDYGNFN